MPLLFRNIFLALNCQEATIMQSLVKEGAHKISTGKKLNNPKYIIIYTRVLGGNCGKFCT